jgi:hypothetical protein
MEISDSTKTALICDWVFDTHFAMDRINKLSEKTLLDILHKITFQHPWIDVIVQKRPFDNEQQVTVVISSIPVDV